MGGSARMGAGVPPRQTSAEGFVVVQDRAKSKSKASAVPGGRVARFGHMARLATGLAGGMLAEGGRRLARGDYRLPAVSQLILTPANAERLAAQLATLRGAAMKLGQLLSMDAGDILPPALATILARLREDAAPMPRRQLERVLREAWGPGWPKRFADFHWQPVAAASIGQVHRARTPAGRDLALKVQYPGVARSIDSDVDNVMALLRLARLLPEGADLGALVREAKAQLRAEADYLREADNLERFGALLSGDTDFAVPGLERNLCHRTVLAMDFLPGNPIEALADASESMRERSVRQLFRLLFRELFEFRLVQTDPNFANYRVQEATGRIVLLDFGATRAYAKRTVAGYRRFFRGAVERDRAGVLAGLLQIGYLPADALPAHREKLLDLFELATEPLGAHGAYDFSASELPLRVSRAGLDLGLQQGFWHSPPADAVFLHRKLAGLFLLGARLRARVALRPLVEHHL